MAVSVKGNISQTIYGKGDVCLKINPFDSFRMFTLYEDWRNDERKPIDLSNNQKIYLVFKSQNKEIRIPEYDLVNSEYSVDKVNGQVLFKISKKNAVDILSMESNVFYITRYYSFINSFGEEVVSSDEEVLYTGLWAEENSNIVDSYTSQIKGLTALLEERNRQIKQLQETNGKLMAQVAALTAALNNMRAENERLSSEVSSLETKVNEYESGTEFAGEIIGDATQHTIIKGKRYTENQLKDVTEHLQQIYPE